MMVEAVSSSAVSTWLSFERFVSGLEKHCALKYPYWWQICHIASFAGHLSWKFFTFLQHVHCFCRLDFFFGSGFCLGFLPKVCPWEGLPSVSSHLKYWVSLLTPLRTCYWSSTASCCWTIRLTFFNVSSVCSCRRSENYAPLIPTASLSHFILSLIFL